MNYLDLVNNVLRRMREETVTSLYENQQSTVVADMVNDAKRQVEDAHDWSCNRTELIIPTVSGTYEYPLTGSANRATIKDIRNLTSKMFLSEVSSKWIRKQEMVDDTINGQPTYYTLSGVNTAGDSLVKVWPIPDGIYRLSAHVILRQGDLTEEGSETALPHMPIIHMAHALAASERGGVDGAEAAMLMGVAKKSLGDAIQYDAAKNVDEHIWYAV